MTHIHRWRLRLRLSTDTGLSLVFFPRTRCKSSTHIYTRTHGHAQRDALHLCFSSSYFPVSYLSISSSSSQSSSSSCSPPSSSSSSSNTIDNIDAPQSSTQMNTAGLPSSSAGKSTSITSSTTPPPPPPPPPSSLTHYDLVVIGSGPAGQKAAINAAKQKKRVAIIDKREMYGGVCIHTGTIPSKTFRESVLHLTGYRQRGFYGKGFVRRDDVSSVNILERVQKVEQWETQTILDQLHRNRVVCIQGTAKFLDPHHIEIQTDKPEQHNTSHSNSTTTAQQKSTTTTSTGTGSGTATTGSNREGDKSRGGVIANDSSNSSGSNSSNTSGSSNVSSSSVIVGGEPGGYVVYGEHVLIACGTRPARNDLFPFSSPLVFDADQILQRQTWDSVRHLIVIGGGVIAMEYASMFNALPGCRVTIIDERPSILDFIDHEVIQTLKHIMGRSGATFRLGEKVVQVEAKETSVRVTLDSGKTVLGDALFYAVGRQANTDTLCLSNAGVTTAKRGLIPVNEFFQTNVPHIYAAGDIVGFPALASTAMEQGRLASQHMWNHGKKMKPLFPYGIYTIPEISVIGESEQDLTKMKIPYEVGIAKFEETAKGQMIGGQHIDGFLKLLFDPVSRKLLGVCAIGESAVEIIHIGQSVMNLGGTIEYFRDSVFNYPTMAETYRVAALDGLGRLAIAQ